MYLLLPGNDWIMKKIFFFYPGGVQILYCLYIPVLMCKVVCFILTFMAQISNKKNEGPLIKTWFKETCITASFAKSWSYPSYFSLQQKASWPPKAIVFLAIGRYIGYCWPQGHSFQGLPQVRCVLASQWSTRWHIICQSLSQLLACFDSN